MAALIRSIVRHVLGWGCLLLGIAGLVLPVIQGWLFIMIGVLLLSPDIPAFARLLAWIETRVPRLRPVIHVARRRVAGKDAPPEPPSREP